MTRGVDWGRAPWPRSDESGSATPVVLATLAVIIAVSLAVVDAGAVLVARSTAASAADLSALAAARVDRDARAEGHSRGVALGTACDTARVVASRNGTTVVACQRGAQSSVILTVESHTGAWPVPLAASARAGAALG